MSGHFKVDIIGRAGQNPELRATASGASMATVSLAIDQYAGEGKTTTVWQRAVAFGGIAERLAKYVHKGNVVAVGGRMSERKWVDGEGTTRVSREVVINELTLLPNGPRPTEEETVANEAAHEAAMGEAITDDLP